MGECVHNESHTQMLQNFGRYIFSILTILFFVGLFLSWTVKNDTEVNKDNLNEFKNKYLGKSEEEIYLEFGTPNVYVKPNKTIGVVGYMSYRNSFVYLDYLINGGIKGLHYKNKVGMEVPIAFILNQNFEVVDLGSPGFETDGLSSGIDVTQ